MIAICIPSGDMVRTGFATSLALLTAQLRAPFCLINVRSSDIENSRNETVKQALAYGCDELLWLDSDIEFPANIYSELKAMGENLVGCSYRTRDGKRPAHQEIRGGSGDEVVMLPAGAMLIQACVYRGIREDWYERQRVGGVRLGEDASFCQRAREAGYRIYINRKLSAELIHLGEAKYKLNPMESSNG